MAGNLGDGIELMLFGMGTVFIFLALLVFLTTTMSNVINKFFPEPPPTPRATPSAGGSAANQGGVANGQLVTVITAAIHRHREKLRK